MAKMTITEALSEVNLIKKKVVAARDVVKTNLARPKHVKDPFEKDGGTAAVIDRQVQSIYDLTARLERIRGAVSSANLANTITVGEQTKTIFDWLTWKREVAEDQKSFVGFVYTQTKNLLDNAARNPQAWKDEEGKTHLVELQSNVDLGAWLRKQEIVVEMVERLDGLLSLKNATITVEV